MWYIKTLLSFFDHPDNRAQIVRRYFFQLREIGNQVFVRIIEIPSNDLAEHEMVLVILLLHNRKVFIRIPELLVRHITLFFQIPDNG